MLHDILRHSVTRVGVVLLVLAPPVHAHQYWLSPSNYSPAPGELVDVRAYSGTGFRGEAKRWSPARCVEFSTFSYRAFSLSTLVREDSLVWARSAFSDPAGTWLQYQSNHASIELPAAEFDAYLETEGLTGPLAERRRAPREGAVRERYRRCAKVWFAGRDERRATRVLGQPLELVPLSAPGASPVLRLRVLWLGRPLAGATVKAWRQPWGTGGGTRAIEDRDSVGAAQRERSDARGEVSLDVAAPGEWLVSTVHMVPSTDRAAADWESTWASLTFGRRESAAGARRGMSAPSDTRVSEGVGSRRDQRVP